MQDKSNFWLLGVVIFLIAAVLGLFGYVLSKEMNKKKQIDAEINSLQQEADKIRKENMQMKERISYLASNDYKEVEAKEKLNLQNPDEKLVIITQSPLKKEENKEETVQVQPKAPTQVDSAPNWRKWWNYFFE